ncbi:hypothetical protein DVH24_033398 [Malus domestica]|uniref:Protein kinase domain-containing protein n=1 Tax=Malus domestica TaxID=3750 RepID=A0A498JFI8_MALDO|nr:hypothetical protein DVH24_033398 [Malus domestica]
MLLARRNPDMPQRYFCHLLSKIHVSSCNYFWLHNGDGEDIESQSRTAANAPEMFTYKQLLVATQNFSKENLLGAGAFGVVYKGILSSHPPKIVAIKKISATSKKGEREYLAEICTIGRLRHKNIGHRFLVYEYMPNGSLNQYIGKPYIDWRTRYKILIGLASAFLYLHEEWQPCGAQRH